MTKVRIPLSNHTIYQFFVHDESFNLYVEGNTDPLEEDIVLERTTFHRETAIPVVFYHLKKKHLMERARIHGSPRVLSIITLTMDDLMGPEDAPPLPLASMLALRGHAYIVQVNLDEQWIELVLPQQFASQAEQHKLVLLWTETSFDMNFLSSSFRGQRLLARAQMVKNEIDHEAYCILRDDENEEDSGSDGF